MLGPHWGVRCPIGGAATGCLHTLGCTIWTVPFQPLLTSPLCWLPARFAALVYSPLILHKAGEHYFPVNYTVHVSESRAIHYKRSCVRLLAVQSTQSQYSRVGCKGVTPAAKWTRRHGYGIRVSAVSILDDDTVSIAVVLINNEGRGSRSGSVPFSADGTSARCFSSGRCMSQSRTTTLQ